MNKLSDKISDFRQWLKGKKTYLICAGAIIAVVIVWGDGDMTHYEAIKAIFEAVVGMTIRAGISKVLG